MNIFEVIGVASIISILGAIICAFVLWVKDEFIPEIVYTYRRKHRFDKPPIAKCYCRDCKNWNPSTGECDDHCNSRRMGAGWFCCFAEPASKEEIAKREKENNYD